MGQGQKGNRLMMTKWVPAMLLAGGWLLSVGVRPQLSSQLRKPLAEAVPTTMAGARATDRTMSEEERVIAAPTEYLLRTYGDTPGPSGTNYQYSVYVGYYERQTRGQTIHSPKNCLPGGGWEALANTTAAVNTPRGPVQVNQYLVHRKGQSALVVYWYQGRGRVESNEYLVKWNLLRDAALKRRSEEALVRVMVPVTSSEDRAFELASKVAAELVAAMNSALPT
jgi:EpsI family protein